MIELHADQPEPAVPLPRAPQKTVLSRGDTDPFRPPELKPYAAPAFDPSSPESPATGDGSPRAGGTGGNSSSQPLKVHDAVGHLESHAKPAPDKHPQCAKYVRQAIEAGGVQIKPEDRQLSAKDYGKTLKKVGFDPVVTTQDGENYPPTTEHYQPEKGDVAIIQPATNHSAGHMAMYAGLDKNGRQVWISDFKQHIFWPGDAYVTDKPSYTIYRHQSKE
jgi:hypothetical protein